MYQFGDTLCAQVLYILSSQDLLQPCKNMCTYSLSLSPLPRSPCSFSSPRPSLLPAPLPGSHPPSHLLHLHACVCAACLMCFVFCAAHQTDTALLCSDFLFFGRAVKSWMTEFQLRRVPSAIEWAKRSKETQSEGKEREREPSLSLSPWIPFLFLSLSLSGLP